jgi:hypothetical protein
LIVVSTPFVHVMFTGSETTNWPVLGLPRIAQLKP